MLNVAAVKLEEDTKELLELLSNARKRSMNWMIRQAVREYAQREGEKEKLRQEAVKAWMDYSVSDLHLSGGEADAWLAQLEAGENVEIPKCHV